jgi:hypothetical protein
VTLDLPESLYGADSDPWNWTHDLTGPVWREARDAIVKVADVRLGGVALPVSAFSSAGWIRVDGERARTTARCYIADYRTYDGFDARLKDCCQWSYDHTSWVDWFSYTRGLHLVHRDTSFMDIGVATHVDRGELDGRGRHPKPDGVAYSDGATDHLGCWRPRIQVRDASFGTGPTKTQSIYIVDHDQGWGIGECAAPGETAHTWFKDSRTYWYATAPAAGSRPREPGRAHQDQGHGIRLNEDLGRQQEVTRRRNRVLGPRRLIASPHARPRHRRRRLHRQRDRHASRGART